MSHQTNLFFQFFLVLQEAFSAAKLAFSNFKLQVRSKLVSSHTGPDTLEEYVQDYINRNADLYDISKLVSVSPNFRLSLGP